MGHRRCRSPHGGWVRPDPDGYTDALYAGAKAHLRPVHDAIIAMAEGLGEDAHREGRGTYIPVVRRTQFVAVAPVRGNSGFRFRGEVPDDERLSCQGLRAGNPLAAPAR